MHVSMDNYVNKIRLQLKNRYVDDELRINTDLIIKDMNFLKDNDYDMYIKLLSILYPAFFLLNEEAACDYEEQILEEECDESINLDDDFEDDLYGLDESFTIDFFFPKEEHTAEDFYSLDDIDNIYDLIDWIKIDNNILIDIFKYNFEFLDEGYFNIRELLNRFNDCDPYLFDMSSLWFIDKCFYCSEITTDDINYKYLVGINNNIDRVEIIDSVVNYVTKLGKYDPENYKTLVVDIMNDSYKYQKYLLMSKSCDQYADLVEKSVDYIEKKSISDINSCSINGDNLYTILDFYFEFIEYQDYNEKKIDEFCNKNKCKIKKIYLR